jgi:hypothetical protein
MNPKAYTMTWSKIKTITNLRLTLRSENREVHSSSTLIDHPSINLLLHGQNRGNLIGHRLCNQLAQSRDSGSSPHSSRIHPETLKPLCVHQSICVCLLSLSKANNQRSSLLLAERLIQTKISPAEQRRVPATNEEKVRRGEEGGAAAAT